MFKKLKRVLKHDPEHERELREGIESEGVEKKDMPPMIISAYLTFIPIVFAILMVFALVAYLFVR